MLTPVSACQVNSLLPPAMFLSVVSGLLSSELPVVRRRAMELLATRLQLQPDYFTEADTEALLRLTRGMAPSGAPSLSWVFSPGRDVDVWV